jgi:TPR repeat protein
MWVGMQLALSWGIQLMLSKPTCQYLLKQMYEKVSTAAFKQDSCQTSSLYSCAYGMDECPFPLPPMPPC